MQNLPHQFRSSTLGWLLGTIAGWGTLLLAIAGPVGMVLAGGGILPIPAWAPLMLSLLALAVIIWVWVENLAARYDLSEDRLTIRRGIFIKSIDDIELYRVKDVRLDFSLINQMAGIGTISIDSSDETTASQRLAMRHVAGAAMLREQMRSLVEAARLKRRVREVDIGHDAF